MYERITVASEAAPEHFQHGDASIGDPVPEQPGSVFDGNCVAVAGATVYIAAVHPEAILIFNTAGLSEIGALSPSSLGGLAIAPDRGLLYATRPFPDPGGVFVVETATRSVVATVDEVGRNLAGELAISADEAFAYVPYVLSRPGTDGVPPGYDGKLSAIETRRNTVVETVDFDGDPSAVAVSPDGSLVYVAVGPAQGKVVAIDARTMTVEAVIGVGQTPGGVAFTPDGAFAYVTNFNSNSVSVIDTTTSSVVATIPDQAALDAGPEEVAITPDGKLAYVSNDRDHTVAVIETATKTLIDRIVVGRQPAGLAITPDGAFVWVVNFAGSSVSVIETAGNTVVATLPLDHQPIEIVISPGSETSPE